MPNYTHNELIVYGKSDELKYFYERNRMTEEDAKYMQNSYVCELSFEKCVPRAITKVIESYIQEKYTGKTTKDPLVEHFQHWDLLCTIWGTKWGACDPTVDLSEINNETKPHIKYNFDTAWNYPYNWLFTISQIFPTLRFKIKHSNEDDGYNTTYIDEFKNGIETKIEKYSAIHRCIEENGNAENLVHMIIEYLTIENVMIDDYQTSSENGTTCEKVNWLIYCKNFLEKKKNKKENKYDLFLTITENIDEFMSEKKIHTSLYLNDEITKCFVEKIKNM